MSKPDWKDAPEWANWLAMDNDGLWFWYDKEPEFEGSEWMPPVSVFRSECAGCTNSHETLERRP